MNILLLPGQIGYSFGSYSDAVPPTNLYISRTSADGAHTTFYVSVWQGPNPVPGQLITTANLANVPNVNSTPITSVSLDASGTGTILVASSANAPLAHDVGLALVPQAEVPAAISVSLPQAGSSFALPQSYGPNARVLTWQTSYPSAPASVQAVLEAAMGNPDAPSWFPLDTSTSVAGDLRFVSVQDFQVVRVSVAASNGGTLPTVIAKISI